MKPRAIFTLAAKDLRLYFANPFFALITILGLVVFIAAFYLLPSTVEESFEIAMYAASLPKSFLEEMDDEGLVLRLYLSEDDLINAVQSGVEQVGIALPDNLMGALSAGEKPQAHIYFSGELPPEFNDIYIVMMEELGYLLTGSRLELQSEEVIIGPDMAGEQVGPRQRMLPLMGLIILIMEVLGLASLITIEIETGTLSALLVTPLRVEGLFLAKSLSGIGMALIQSVLFYAITGGFQRQVLLVAVLLLLGALLMTGVSFLLASLGRDMMSVMGWGVLMLIILILPALQVMLPGLVSDWIKVIPTYHLVVPVYQVLNLGAGWGQVGGSLMVLLFFSLAFFALGIWSLHRRFA